jgi:hypothetical protein
MAEQDITEIQWSRSGGVGYYCILFPEHGSCHLAGNMVDWCRVSVTCGLDHCEFVKSAGKQLDLQGKSYAIILRQASRVFRCSGPCLSFCNTQEAPTEGKAVLDSGMLDLNGPIWAGIEPKA